jgi:transposase-like protein
MEKVGRRQRVYSLKTRERAVQLAKEIKESGECSLNGVVLTSLRQLAKALDLRDESTLRYWIKQQCWDSDSVKERLANRGAKPMLAPDEQELVENFVLECCEQHKHCGGEEIIEFCFKVRS